MEKLHQMGFIEPIIKIVIVKRKTGKWRLCFDFRKINANSVRDKLYPDATKENAVHQQLKSGKSHWKKASGSTRLLQCKAKVHSSGG